MFPARIFKSAHQKVIPIGIPVEYLPSLNPAKRNMGHGIGCIYA